MKPEIRVNRKFLIFFISFQVIVAGITFYALTSPKTVTVQVERLNSSYDIEVPLEIVPPKV